MKKMINENDRTPFGTLYPVAALYAFFLKVLITFIRIVSRVALGRRKRNCFLKGFSLYNWIKNERMTLTRKFVENYEQLYGYISYSNKIVLDIGADYGSTAKFFLRKGCKKVIAVEPELFLFHQLYKSASLKVTPIRLLVTDKRDFETLINLGADIVKVDCEGCEKFLLDVDDLIFKKVKEYVIEIHNSSTLKAFQEKFKANGFTIKHILPWASLKGTIVWAVKETKK